MKDIHINNIIRTVREKIINVNIILNDDILNSIKCNIKVEESNCGKDILEQILENANIAEKEKLAICQDTGMVVAFVEIGQEVRIVGGSLEEAINEGIRKGYKDGYLRKSVVLDPLIRLNTNDNTPAIIHYNLVEGDNLKISLLPKGFGSENMSRLAMLKPSHGIEGVKSFILETIEKAGPNPCPPIVVGVGIGGTFDKVAIMAKKALLRPIDIKSDINHIRDLEEEMLVKINRLGIGPGGLGGRVTALGINIDIYPTHIAGLPVAVNVSCHATRHGEILL
ncbi:MAG: fumarate hydratase [Clostridiales bacterium]